MDLFTASTRWSGCLVLLLCLVSQANCQATVCVSGTDYAGYNDPTADANKNPTAGDNTDFQGPDAHFLSVADNHPTDDMFVMGCCGVVKKWELEYPGSVLPADIDMHVWRGTGTTDEWQQLGVNSITLAATKEFTIAVADQINVIPGDVIGFTQIAKATLSYKECATVNPGNCQGTKFSTTNTSPMTWNTDSSTVAGNAKFRSYGIKAHLGPRLPPSCSSAVVSTIDTYTGLVHIVTASGFESNVTFSVVADTGINQTHYTLTMINGSSAQIDAITPWPSTCPFVMHRIQLRVEECGTSDCYIDFNVTYTNYPINITNLDSAQTNALHEDDVIEIYLFPLNLYDANPSPPDGVANCSLINSTGDGMTKFTVTEDPAGSGTYVVKNMNGTWPVFDFDIQTNYTLCVECYDLCGASSIGCLTVELTENIPPVVNMSLVVVISAKIVVNLDLITTIDIIDPDDVLIGFNATFLPDPPPFTFATVSGTQAQITANQDLLDHEIKEYNVTICVWDKRTVLCNNTLTIYITGINNRPKLNDLDNTILVPENTPAGNILYNAGLTDPDIANIHTFYMQVSPPAATPMFTLNSTTGVVTLTPGQSFDFETESVYYLTFALDDGIHPALVNGTLRIDIGDVNEPISFALPVYTITHEEGVAGTLLGTPAFVTVDVDINDTRSFTIVGGDTNNRFTMDSLDASLYFNVDYDIDNGAMPTVASLTVAVKDKGGITDTTTLIVTLTDVNDKTPTFASSSHTIYVYNDTVLSTPLLTVAATDDDYETTFNAAFDYSIAGVGNGANYFTVDAGGNIMLTKSVNDTSFRDTFIMTVFATDRGTPPLRGFTHVTVIYSPTPTPTTPPEQFDVDCFFCTTWGVILFAFLMATAAAIVLFGLFVLLRYFIYPNICHINWSFCGRCFGRCCKIQKKWPPRNPKRYPEEPRRARESSPVRKQRPPSPAKTPEPIAPVQSTYRNPFWSRDDWELDNIRPRPS